MSGTDIWTAIVNVRDLIYQLCSDFAGLMGTPIPVLIRGITDVPIIKDILGIIATFFETFGSPTLLDLMFGLIPFVIALTLARWIISLIPGA